MRRNELTVLVAIQSIINGIWLFWHDGKENFTSPVQGFKHTAFLDSPVLYILAVGLGIGLLYASYKNSRFLKKLLLSFMNGMWTIYTTVLIINEINGVPNMSWALFLGYNMAIFLAARSEVLEK